MLRARAAALAALCWRDVREPGARAGRDIAAGAFTLHRGAR